jgi:dienelactone hydrolase
VTNLHAVDSSRVELLTDDPSDFRQVAAQVWYPARPGATDRPEKYRTREMTRAAASFLGWPAFFNSFFELVDSYSYPEAAADETGAPYPVVLYHHGYGGFTRVHVALIEDLVSHGYVVASIGHAFESAFLEMPDGSLVSFEPGNQAYVGRLDEAHGAEQERLKDRIVEARTIEAQEEAYRALLDASPRHQESTRTWAADGSFVLDRLAKLNVTVGPLEGLLALTRVGAIGHSLGGAAAGQAIAEDPRVTAGVDLDGFMFGDLIDSRSEAALMLVSAARPQAALGGSALTLFFERAPGPAYLLVIEGFEHATFTDLPLFLGAWPGEGSAADGARALGIQRAYVRTFFDRHLREADGALLDGPSEDFPEAAIRSRNAP